MHELHECTNGAAFDFCILDRRIFLPALRAKAFVKFANSFHS